MDFKHKEASVSISRIVKRKIQALAELLKRIMILGDLGLLSIFTREAVTVMTGRCYSVKNTSSINCLRLREKHIIPRGAATRSPVAATHSSTADLQTLKTPGWDTTTCTLISSPLIKPNRSPHAPMSYKELILKCTSPSCKVTPTASKVKQFRFNPQKRQGWP